MKLYKVSSPRTETLFQPTTFWHSPDWESSTTRHRAGYIREDLLYAGDLDEVTIHLFPRVRTVRVRVVDACYSTLGELGLSCDPGKSAYVFIEHGRRHEVEAFSPTIFTFRADGFERVRRGEYVSRQPQRAVSSETVSMAEAMRRWNVQACYVDDLDDLIGRLTRASVYFDEQT